MKSANLKRNPFFLPFILGFIVFSVSIDSTSNAKGDDAPFHRIIGQLIDYSRDDWDGLHHHLRDIQWNGIFQLVASASVNEFCEWF